MTERDVIVLTALVWLMLEASVNAAAVLVVVAAGVVVVVVVGVVVVVVVVVVSAANAKLIRLKTRANTSARLRVLFRVFIL